MVVIIIVFVVISGGVRFGINVSGANLPSTLNTSEGDSHITMPHKSQ